MGRLRALPGSSIFLLRRDFLQLETSEAMIRHALNLNNPNHRLTRGRRPGIVP